MRRLIASAILGVACVAIGACGNEEPKSSRAAAPEQRPSGRELLSGSKPPPAAPSATTPAPAPGAKPAAPAAAPSSIPFADATPEQAMETFMKRLVAGDFRGASDVCDPESIGAKSLRNTADGFDRAAADGGLDPELVKRMVTQDLKPITWEKTTESGDRAEFTLTSPTKPPRTLAVVKMDGVWRVIPPDAGIP